MGIKSAIGGFFIGALIAVNLTPTEVKTVTHEKRVEVPGPEVIRTVQVEMPESCMDLVDLVQRQYDVMVEYSRVLAPMESNLSQMNVAVVSKDHAKINAIIEEQGNFHSEATGLLQEIVTNDMELETQRTECDTDTEAE